ncbi:CBS domain-containing protein [Radiobacillus kanasensis]|uniref:CBS domain-containing protein n=1 Tax=Radiobacillus kanasensis TaxID=2844358 RepID=UPI001E5C6EDB|nr:CBS domain-containing protein [Radiobacillus kanasensis]UFT97650.1 CBS domain-containing protein [Radiobacillus kanasensis]
MFVKSTMLPSHKCLIAVPNDSLAPVLQQLEEKDIEAMPVVNGEQFVGMISKQIIYKSFYYSDISKHDFLHNTTVQNVMTGESLSLKEDDVFEHTLSAFKGFPILAVVDEHSKFLGIVTRFDVIEAFESAFGVKKRGVRIAFTSEESTGRLSRLADLLKQFHTNVISVATFDETDKLARRIVIKIDESNHLDKLVQKLEKSGFRVLDVKEM